MVRERGRNKQVVLFSVAFLWIGAVLGAVVARQLATVTPEQMRQLMWPLVTVCSLVVALISSAVALKLWWENRAVKLIRQARLTVARRLRQMAERVAGEVPEPPAVTVTVVETKTEREPLDPVGPVALIEAASRKYGRTVVAAGTGGIGGWY